MDPLLHLCGACLLWIDEVRASAKQVVVCADLSTPPKCMEPGDYIHWVLQTTNHITYGNLLEMHKCYRYVFMKISGQHIGETLSDLGLICYLWRLLPGCVLYCTAMRCSLMLKNMTPINALQLCVYTWGLMMKLRMPRIIWHTTHEHNTKEKWQAGCGDYVYSIC